MVAADMKLLMVTNETVDVSQKFLTMPFAGRSLGEKHARMGLVECVSHELLQPYPIFHETPGKSFSHCLAKGGNRDPIFVNALVTWSIPKWVNKFN
uniref:ERBB-3 binding protein 1 n=2 Tax=Tanacetum cinerariifolium TaxID=118510 RepID=A0A699L446_TANCI|nr:ERBB-3 binding protein 1 [Tanacetum cinerariifolium]